VYRESNETEDTEPMTDPTHSTDPTAERPTDDAVSRRTVVKTTAAATTLLATAGVGAVTAQETTFRLGGEVGGWQGQSPSSIQGETDPTLELEAGTEYTIVWENLDGAPHNVVIEDENGNNLVRTEVMSTQGTTQSVTFTASEEMNEYYCEIHPQSMRGGVSVSGSDETETPEETETPAETETETAASATETETPAEATATETPTQTETPAETPTETPTQTTPSDGPTMADDVCPSNETAGNGHGNKSCPTPGNETDAGGDTDGDRPTDDDFRRLIRLLIRLLRRLLGTM